MALHVFHLSVGPHPISPFILYLILRNGPKHDRKEPPVVDFKLDFIQRLCPPAGRALTPWFDLTPEDKLPQTSTDEHQEVLWLLQEISQGNPVCPFASFAT